MTDHAYTQLLSPLQIGTARLRNRMVFTAHDALLQEAGQISDKYVAYQVARTRGGAGLQILAGASVESSGLTFEFQLRLDNDEAIPGFRAMAEAVHAEGGTVFAQLLHAGRESYSCADGCRPVTFSASAARSERFFIVPRELSQAEIKRIVASYARAARRAVAAGLDGIEICANQGNLPAQFLAESINRRTDEYGGTAENRSRFLIELCAAVRAAIGNIPLGVRLSAADLDNAGLTEDESLDSFRRLDNSGLIDYLHVVLGTGSTRAGAFHIVAPMAAPAGYVAPYAERVKKVVRVPVIATGRFNTPHSAEAALRSGCADAIGMTRAMICDPQLGRKVRERRSDDIRACIGCDQACIGHLQRGYPVSCIQFPESGRERTLGSYGRAEQPRRILVAGGGPAGMKAASVAAARGHHVVLCEAGSRLGGQANLAAKVMGRAEFGGIVTNLSREVNVAGVEVRLRTEVTRALVEAERPDVVLLATGGRTPMPDPALTEGIHVVTANAVLDGPVEVGNRVVIADATCDWVGIGVALQLAANGHRVTLAVTGVQPGETIPSYVRDESCGRLFEAGVEIINYARLFGADGGTVYFEHVCALQPIVIEGVDTLVICTGVEADRSLELQLAGLQIERHIIGDCLTPRTAEEAVLDALKISVGL